MGPQLYLILALAAAVPSTYGYMWVSRERAIKDAYQDGKSAGGGSVAASTTAASQNTVNKVREGEDSVPPVPAERVKLIDLCKRSASCRERNRVGGPNAKAG